MGSADNERTHCAEGSAAPLARKASGKIEGGAGSGFKNRLRAEELCNKDVAPVLPSRRCSVDRRGWRRRGGNGGQSLRLLSAGRDREPSQKNRWTKELQLTPIRRIESSTGDGGGLAEVI